MAFKDTFCCNEITKKMKKIKDFFFLITLIEHARMTHKETKNYYKATRHKKYQFFFKVHTNYLKKHITHPSTSLLFMYSTTFFPIVVQHFSFHPLTNITHTPFISLPNISLLYFRYPTSFVVISGNYP